MLAQAVMFWQVILAVHIAAVVIAFGVVFCYPLIVVTADRIDRRSIPTIHRIQQTIGRRVINPGLAIVLAAGIYLASNLHQWGQFYVQWAIAVVIVIGGLEGSVMIRSEGRLAELAERDLAGAPPAAETAAGSSAAPALGRSSDSAAATTTASTWSPEYLALRARAGIVGTVMALLIVVTVYLMAVQA